MEHAITYVGLDVHKEKIRSRLRLQRRAGGVRFVSMARCQHPLQPFGLVWPVRGHDCSEGCPADSMDIIAGAARTDRANAQAANRSASLHRCRTGLVRQPKPVRKTPDEL